MGNNLATTIIDQYYGVEKPQTQTELQLNLPSRKDVVTAFVEDIADEVNFDEFFHGHCPSSITDMVLKYSSPNVVSLGDTLSRVMESNSETNVMRVLTTSCDEKQPEIIYQNDISIELKPETKEYEIEWNLELLSLPKHADHVIINYHLLSATAGVDWQNIKKLRIGQVASASPSTMKQCELSKFQPMEFMTSIQTMMIV